MHVPPEHEGSSPDGVEPTAEVEAEPVIELQLKAGEEPVFDISHPAPAEDQTPSLSFDAFKDIKPVAFGGVGGDEGNGEAGPAQEIEPVPVPDAAPQPEPVADVAPQPEPVADVEPVIEIATEPIAYVEPEPAPVAIEPEPVAEIEPDLAAEPEPAAQLEAPAEAKKKGRFSIPNPEIKLPSFSRKTKAEKPAKEPKEKRGFKLPNPQLKLPALSIRKKDRPVAAKPAEASGEQKKSFLTLPENLQGPLSEVERKIVLCGVAAIFAAGAFGFATAPAEEPVTPTPPSAVPAR